MKRVLTILAILLLPLSVWAMTPVSDSELSNVTGQAGVNINADLLMNVSIGTMAWGDSTGLDGYYDPTGTDAGGYIGMRNFNITNLSVQAREQDNYNGYIETSHLKPISIDVATSSLHGAGVTFVRIGLGALEIKMDRLNFMVELGTSGATLGQRLGEVYLGNMAIYMNPTSYVDIFKSTAQTGSGVTFSMDITIDRFMCDTMSWGDTDGLTLTQSALSNYWIGTSADPGAGYIGFRNFLINGTITVVGDVGIDVSSISNGKYALTTLYYAGQPGNGVVHITFGQYGVSNFRFNVNGAITANVCLGSNNTLTAGTTELGDIYISGFGVEILGGSWVDIWAH